MAMAVPLSPSEPYDVGNHGASESIIFPCEPAQFDKQITRDDLRAVHQCLAPVSVKWHTIGVYLRLPKGKLDVIESDFPNTDRRLTEMIDTWINTGTNCTWRWLDLVLRDCGYVVKLVSTTSEIFELKEPQNEASGNFWEEKQKARSEQETTFRSSQALANKSRDHCMMELRANLVVPNAGTNEVMLKNIELYFPIKLFFNPDNFFTFTRIIKDITNTFKDDQKCLEVWSHFLTTDMNMVRDKLLTLATEKERLINSLEIQQTNNSASSNHTIRKKKTQKNKSENKIMVHVSVITEDIESANSYQKSFHHRLHTCLNNVHSTIKQTENLKCAINSFKKAYKGVQFTILTLAICMIPCMVVLLPLASKLVTRLSLIVGTLVIITVAEFTQRIPRGIIFAGIYRRSFLLCALTGAVAAVLLLVVDPMFPLRVVDPIFPLRVVDPIFPISSPLPTEKNPSTLNTTNSSPHSLNTFSEYILIFTLGLSVGCLVVVAVLVLNTTKSHFLGYFGTLAITCFLLITQRWDSLLNNYLIAFIGLICGIILSSTNRDLLDILCTKIGAIVAMLMSMELWISGIVTGVQCGEWISQHKIVVIIAAAMGGALAQVFLLAVASYTKFPYFVVDIEMDDSIQQLMENIHKLEVIKVNTQKLLSEARTEISD